MHLARGIQNSIFIGLITGSLLAATSMLWQTANTPFILPIMVAFWWLIIFGCNLWHVYKVSNVKISNTKRFALQVVHALVAVGIYWVADVFGPTGLEKNLTAQNTPEVLHAQIIPEVYNLLTNTEVFLPAAFILSLITSGLLFSILNRPAAK